MISNKIYNLSLLRRAISIFLILAAALCVVKSAECDVQTKNKKHPNKSNRSVPAPELHRILLFPVDAKFDDSAVVTEIIGGVEESRLNLSSQYSPVYFLSSIPTVKRALLDSSLSPADVAPPFYSETKIKKLSEITACETALVSVIEDFKYDTSHRNFSFKITIQLLDFKNSSKAKNQVSQTASSTVNSAKDLNDISSVLPSVRDVTEKLMTALLKPTKQNAAVPAQSK